MDRIRGYLGMSLDGRIAGPGDDLGWLTTPWVRSDSWPIPSTGDDYLDYEAFIADVGAMLMGRRTYDVAIGFDEWPYGDMPVVVATTRPLDPVVASVEAASGALTDLVAIARARAGGADVYADGGQLVSALLGEGLLDELTTTILPTVRGPGVGLFDALRGPADLVLTRVATSDEGFAQLTWELASEAGR